MAVSPDRASRAACAALRGVYALCTLLPRPFKAETVGTPAALPFLTTPDDRASPPGGLMTCWTIAGDVFQAGFPLVGVHCPHCHCY